MVYNIIYLLFKNNYDAFTNLSYVTYFIKSMVFFTCTYTAPLFLLDYMTDITRNNVTNRISKIIFKVFYFFPCYIVFIIIHNSRLIKLLEKKFIVYNNPSHIYMTLFFSFIYLFMSIINSILYNNPYTYALSFLLDSLGYGLYFNEIVYIFLDNLHLNYSNKIDFYNTYFIIFSFFGCILSYIMQYVNILFYMPVSFFVTSIIQNALIHSNYQKYSDHNIKYNLLMPLENLFNIFVNVISGIIFYYLHRRRLVYDIGSI